MFDCSMRGCKQKSEEITEFTKYFKIEKYRNRNFCEKHALQIERECFGETLEENLAKREYANEEDN